VTIGAPGQIVIGLVSGFLAGLLHYGSLWWNTRLFAVDSASKAVLLQLARITVAVTVLTSLALLGFATLASSALAFLVARPVLIWRFGALR
jgi:F1F0 ATPase subunit 2